MSITNIKVATKPYKRRCLLLSETIKLNVTVDHKRFYSSDSMWGVYGFTPNTNRDKIEGLDWKGVFAVSGNTPELTIGSDYDIEITPSYNEKYGKGYSFIMVAAKRPTSVKEQQEYIKAMVTDRQYKEILKVYPNDLILDLMEKDEFDFTEIKGIGVKTYQKIKKYLFDNLEIQEALVELKDLDISFNSMKKLIEYFGDSRTLVQRVNSNIYELCNVSGFGFKKIDAYALNRGDDPTSGDRILAAIKHTLKQDADRGDSWISIPDIAKELDKLLEINIGYINDMLENISEKDKTIYKDEENRIALRNNYVYEKNFYEKLIKMSRQPSFTKVDNIEEKIKSLEKKNGFEYTSEQKEAIKKSVGSNVLIVNGRAGTGKSTNIKGIVDLLEDYSYMSVALSGKAVKVLKNNGLRAQTIHKTLMQTIDYETGDSRPMPYDIIIVDEASMVNNQLFYELTEALKKDAKLIIVGDNGQLPAIGSGANFDNVIRFGDKIAKQELTIIHRQAQKSGILSAANTIRDGEQINSPYSLETEVYGELEDMVLIPTDDETNIKDMVLDIAKRNKDKDLFEFQVITGRVDVGELSVQSLNKELQKVFNDVNRPFVSRGAYEYRVGDKVIQNGNNYEANVYQETSPFETEEIVFEETMEVFNGTLGKIVDIHFDHDKTRKDHKVHIRFEDEEKIVEYSVNDMSQVGLAYALTVHKLQGSSSDNVVFAFDGASFMLLSREFVYTGITRAKKGCIMIAENKILHMGVKKVSGGNRRTFLKDMLIAE